MFLSPSFSSEDPKKPATDAQGDQSLTYPHLILYKWMGADYVCIGLCVCCVYICLHHTLHGTQYVWWHASAPSLQLFPPDAPRPRLVPSPRLAGPAAALPSLCVRPNLEWRIQLVSNLLTVSDSGSACGPVIQAEALRLQDVIYSIKTLQLHFYLIDMSWLRIWIFSVTNGISAVWLVSSTSNNSLAADWNEMFLCFIYFAQFWTSLHVI